ncbi:MAG: hypothetical protein JW955_20595 [Sedimentisphaerales bacterium]|nr:hypothetical protein [Sedimentisphaerales bacterium]
MKSRVVLRICITLLLTGSLSADTRFTGAVSQLWSNPANWSAGLPDQDDKVQVVDGGFCILDYDAGTIKHTAIEGGGAGHLRLVDGAKLAVRDWSIIGYAGAPEEPHLLEVLGGVYNANARMFIGFLGRGMLVIDYDGVVNLNAQELGIGEDAGGDGTVEIRGGSLNLLSSSALPLRFRAGANSKAGMDVRGGVMTQAFSQARADVINANIANGTIIAYRGVGTVIVETIDGQLVVKGLHPLNPVPGDGDNITPGDVTLSWSVAPGTPVDVWFGTSADLSAAQLIVTKKVLTSIAVTVDPKTRYYWAVDTYTPGVTDPNWGPIFDFYVDNLAPVVKTGADVTTWLKDGIAEVAISATIEDMDPTTSVWSVTTEPNDGVATIADATAAATTVTLGEAGTYVLQITANDGEKTGSDTLTINVYNDSCEAAQSLPDYVPIPGDINGDCRVNDEDLAILQAHWLECNALDCADPNQP